MGQDYGFDTFLMERWGGSEPADEKQRRHAAFRALQKKLKDCDIAAPGTIRGDYSMSFQENIVHTSDSPETAAIELTRFFKPEEIFDYKQATFDYLYANDEY